MPELDELDRSATTAPGFVYIGTYIDKTNMPIKNWTYLHEFIGTGIVKTDKSNINGYFGFYYIGTRWYW
jgi:hypothetical protein